MKYLAPLLVVFSLTTLHDPSGEPVYVARDQIVSISPATNCDARAKAKIGIGTTFLCVLESVEEVVNKMGDQ